MITSTFGPAAIAFPALWAARTPCVPRSAGRSGPGSPARPRPARPEPTGGRRRRDAPSRVMRDSLVDRSVAAGGLRPRPVVDHPAPLDLQSALRVAPRPIGAVDGVDEPHHVEAAAHEAGPPAPIAVRIDHGVVQA